jgi:hypothetical protein
VSDFRLLEVTILEVVKGEFIWGFRNWSDSERRGMLGKLTLMGVRT